VTDLLHKSTCIEFADAVITIKDVDATLDDESRAVPAEKLLAGILGGFLRGAKSARVA